MSGDSIPPQPGHEDTLALDSKPTLEPAVESEVGKRIGPYRLLQLIGEGGMGEVWLAEQLEPVRRKVAIKVIKAGMDTKQVVARFDSERQALALMDHPAIARVLDGGSTPEGRPYFVMEYVAGVSITEHCDTHKLSTEERLTLLEEVCEGVQHAHQKAIIHRDLKPSNILVTLVDGKAQPKIIDFGIAKATGARLTEKTLFTEVGAVIGTPEYMSPEQADLTSQDIDTRTDVYSLGVILYQLLTGELPFGSKELRSSGVEELRRQLKEVEPPRPSTKLSTLGGEDAEGAARNRNTDPGALRRQLKGDLDAITMKAMEKDRRRRYGSPSDLAADLQRHLRHEPVLARAPSAAYRLSRYVRRHRLGVGIAGGLVLLLVGFAISTAVQARRIAREAAAAEAVSTFLTHVFEVSDPGEARGNTVTARELLDKAAADVDRSLANQPELRARMLATMAKAYEGLGLFKTAEGLNRRALDAWLANSGGKPTPASVQTAARLAYELFRLGRYPEAEQVARQAVEEGQRSLKKGDQALLGATQSLAMMESMKGNHDAAVSLFRQVYEARRTVLGPEDDGTLRAQLNLGSALSNARRNTEAAATLRDLLAVLDRTRPPENLIRLAALPSLAHLLKTEGKNDEAIAMYRTSVELSRRVMGPEHPNTLVVVSNFGDTLLETGHPQEAESLIRQTMEVRERVLGPDHPLTIESRILLGGTLARLGRFSEAEALLKPAAESARTKIGPRSTEFPQALMYLAGEAALTGRREEAFVYLGQAVDAGATREDLKTEALLDSLHGEPRFEALVKRAPPEDKP
jgi:non-specific serine/threonine protein kinase/serine/threonine-protein kinase